MNTRMRLGEIISITLKGVDLFRKTATVFKSKNNERRTIPLNQRVFELLKAKTKVRSMKTDLVFHSQNHTPLDKGNIRRAFCATLKKTGIQDFRLHDLRHTFATRLVQRGVNLYKVQTLLGHKSPIISQRCAHHYPESLRDAVETLDMVRQDSVTNQSQSQREGINQNG
jgi:integrase